MYIVIVNKMKRICPRVDFSAPADHSVKVNENAKLEKLLGPCQRTGEIKTNSERNQTQSPGNNLKET